jgi:hypothetical protein
MGRATDDQVRRWRDDGWVLVPGLVPAADIDAALDDLFLVVPRPEEFHGGASDDRRADFSNGPAGEPRRHPTPTGDGPAFRAEQFLGRRHFPFPGSGALNRLAVHPNLVDFAERALGSTDLRLYQMSVWAKYTGVADYEQPMHLDNNHSFLPPRSAPGWWHLEGFLYLGDVDEAVAPTRAVSVRDSAGRLSMVPLGPDEAPELYAAEVPAVGPKGSYLAYRPDVFHRGVNLTRPGGARFLYNLSFKLAGQDWIGYENAQPESNTGRFTRFVESCTPRQLALFGVPGPGHAYWTPTTLAAMADRYPGLDLSPWAQALTVR